MEIDGGRLPICIGARRDAGVANGDDGRDDDRWRNAEECVEMLQLTSILAGRE
jgi:hypothetical protein